LALRLVVGLGNPGRDYARTRHNVGFRLADAAAGEASWKKFQGGLGLWAGGGDFWALKPETFMNESGRCVAAFAGFYKIEPSEILVCFDDVALDLGRLRLRPAGSSGGQKGMQSIIDCLGTSEIARLRMGVGPKPAGMDAARFVLGRFSKDEEEKVSSMVERAAEAVKAAVNRGLEPAMNLFNASSAEENNS
jgi:PTH1 family peptidyl-tRNA hydrolase